jgi:hypothetical protein
MVSVCMSAQTLGRREEKVSQIPLGYFIAHCATLNDTGEDEIKRTEEVVAS